jgi:hypoxia up-regulated 1
MKILIFLVVCLHIKVSFSSVIGIDFGSEYFKASLISPGKTFEIIENETSKRKTYNSV